MRLRGNNRIPSGELSDDDANFGHIAFLNLNPDISSYFIERFANHPYKWP